MLTRIMGSCGVGKGRGAVAANILQWLREHPTGEVFVFLPGQQLQRKELEDMYRDIARFAGRPTDALSVCGAFPEEHGWLVEQAVARMNQENVAVVIEAATTRLDIPLAALTGAKADVFWVGVLRGGRSAEWWAIWDRWVLMASFDDDGDSWESEMVRWRGGEMSGLLRRNLGRLPVLLSDLRKCEALELTRTYRSGRAREGHFVTTIRRRLYPSLVDGQTMRPIGSRLRHLREVATMYLESGWRISYGRDGQRFELDSLSWDPSAFRRGWLVSPSRPDKGNKP